MKLLQDRPDAGQPTASLWDEVLSQVGRSKCDFRFGTRFKSGPRHTKIVRVSVRQVRHKWMGVRGEMGFECRWLPPARPLEGPGLGMGHVQWLRNRTRRDGCCGVVPDRHEQDAGGGRKAKSLLFRNRGWRCFEGRVVAGNGGCGDEHGMLQVEDVETGVRGSIPFRR